jgi:hypothetical protein
MGVQAYTVEDDFGSKYLGGDIYIYDTLPGGAGYAREIAANVPDICKLARKLMNQCPSQCDSACYRCLLDYGNQRYHGLLDRNLAIDVINYILDGTLPSLGHNREVQLLKRLENFKSDESQLECFQNSTCGNYGIITMHDGRKVVIKPVHSLSAENMKIKTAIALHTKISSIYCAPAIELERQPFSIWKQAIEVSQ